MVYVNYVKISPVKVKLLKIELITEAPFLSLRNLMKSVAKSITFDSRERVKYMIFVQTKLT